MNGVEPSLPYCHDAVVTCQHVQAVNIALSVASGIPGMYPHGVIPVILKPYATRRN